MTVQLEIPPFVQRDLDEIAERTGVSPQQIMVIAIAEKVSAIQTAEKLAPDIETLRQRYLKILAKVPKRKPMKGDEIPADLRAKLRKMGTKHKARSN
jgi:hypothetical protein